MNNRHHDTCPRCTGRKTVAAKQCQLCHKAEKKGLIPKLGEQHGACHKCGQKLTGTRCLGCENRMREKPTKTMEIAELNFILAIGERRFEDVKFKSRR